MTRRALERGHSFDYMQTDKDFFSPEYIRHILVKLRPWKGLVLISRHRARIAVPKALLNGSSHARLSVPMWRTSYKLTSGSESLPVCPLRQQSKNRRTLRGCLNEKSKMSWARGNDLEKRRTEWFPVGWFHGVARREQHV